MYCAICEEYISNKETVDTVHEGHRLHGRPICNECNEYIFGGSDDERSV